MKLHPLTHIITTLELAVLVVILPVHQGGLVLFLCLPAALLVPSRTGTKMTVSFLKILAAAAFFLFLMHGVRLFPPGLSGEGMRTGFIGFLHVAVPVTAVIHLSRRVTAEELYSLLIDLKVPPVAILVLYRTLWLVPRLMERMDEVVTAQKLRGMKVDSTLKRARAVIPTLSPVFSSMIDEISQNSLTLTARGFLRSGTKSHLLPLRFRCLDAVLTGAVTLVLVVSWF